MNRFLLPAFCSLLLATACSPAKRIGKVAGREVLSAPALRNAHVGISIFEPATGKTWYDHQGDRYFVPASNTKIPTCYAAMKYLGDSLVGLRYEQNEMLVIQPTGDPTFLHPEFLSQPVFAFLRGQSKPVYYHPTSGEQGWGSGWAWNDYDQSYMAERSLMPMYGNVMRIRKGRANAVSADSIPPFEIEIRPAFFANEQVVTNTGWTAGGGISVDRSLAGNLLTITPGSAASVEMPFTSIPTIITRLLADTLKKEVVSLGTANRKLANSIHSQPTDSLLKPMMHRSDNFFAEQSLLMVSNERLGIMNDARIIDTILKTDFADLPQKPRWVDGSGLSRYNLFSPRDFVAILNKMRTEFGMERIKTVFATGNEGTLRNYYVKEEGYLFAKTGTLSGVVAISGYLYTKKDKLLIFSVLVNNHNASATEVRRAVERLIEGIREQY